MATMITGFGGMVGGRGFSGKARRSIEVYLDGRMSGIGVTLGKYVGVGGSGPGKLLRSFLVAGFPLFLVPLFIYLFQWVYLWFQGSQEVCTVAIGMVRVGCKEVHSEVKYGLVSSVYRAYWLLFYTLFEGVDDLPGTHFGRSSLVFGVGSLVWTVSPQIGIMLIFSSLAMTVWGHARVTNFVFRWAVFFLILGSFSPYWFFFEVFTLFDYGKVDEIVVYEPVVTLVPHKYLALSVPEDSCKVSADYFTERVTGDGMTDEQRVVALLGDRFLKLLAAEWVREHGLTVASVGMHEHCQTDEALLLWTGSRLGEVCGGKKTRASFPEVLWGEIFQLHVKGSVGFPEIYAAYLVFVGEVTKVVQKI